MDRNSEARWYFAESTDPVSYTHLDVYKRQAQVHRTGQSRAFFKCIGFDPFHCTKVRDFLQSAALIKRRQPDRSDLPPGCNTLQFLSLIHI